MNPVIGRKSQKRQDATCSEALEEKRIPRRSHRSKEKESRGNDKPMPTAFTYDSFSVQYSKNRCTCDAGGNAISAASSRAEKQRCATSSATRAGATASISTPSAFSRVTPNRMRSELWETLNDSDRSTSPSLAISGRP